MATRCEHNKKLQPDILGRPVRSQGLRQTQVRRLWRLRKWSEISAITPRFVVSKPHLMRPTWPATRMAGVGTWDLFQQQPAQLRG
jgi:hypothetical protein